MGRLETIARLRAAAPAIAPSMLQCDFGNLAQVFDSLHAAPTPVVHWDVMDGHFVPNLSYGAMLIASLRRRSSLVFDAHLMISDPSAYLDDYVKAGCDGITIHIEAVPDPRPLLNRIRTADRVAGLAVNPGTPFEAVEPFLSHCDSVLVMTVNPGFGGQKFMPEVLPKMATLRQAAPNLLIGVDGGIAAETIAVAAGAGAGLFVCGSAVFGAADYAAAVADLAGRAAQPVPFSSPTGRA